MSVPPAYVTDVRISTDWLVDCLGINNFEQMFFIQFCSLKTMKRLDISIGFILIIIGKTNVIQQANLYRDSKHQHANFVKHGNTVLDVPMITSTAFHDDLYCAFECLTHDQCISFNSAIFPDADGKFECQLLATDIYRSSKSAIQQEV